VLAGIPDDWYILCVKAIVFPFGVSLFGARPVGNLTFWEVLIVASSEVTVAEVEQLIAAERQKLDDLRERRESLAAAVAQEEKTYEDLVARRESVRSDLESLAEDLERLRGQGPDVTEKRAAAPPAKSKKPKSKQTTKKGRAGKKGGKPTLKDAMVKILSDADKPMRAKDIAAKLPDAGYKTKSKNPAGMVSAQLGQGDEFRRVRRGVYTLTS
jgi:hypothetical protein